MLTASAHPPATKQVDRAGKNDSKVNFNLETENGMHTKSHTKHQTKILMSPYVSTKYIITKDWTMKYYKAQT